MASRCAGSGRFSGWKHYVFEGGVRSCSFIHSALLKHPGTQHGGLFHAVDCALHPPRRHAPCASAAAELGAGCRVVAGLPTLAALAGATTTRNLKLDGKHPHSFPTLSAGSAEVQPGSARLSQFVASLLRTQRPTLRLRGCRAQGSTSGMRSRPAAARRALKSLSRSRAAARTAPEPTADPSSTGRARHPFYAWLSTFERVPD